MADKASRGLIIYGYSLLPFIKPSHSHIHQLASIGSSGYLALDSPSNLSEGEDSKLIRELAQLLDAREAVNSDVRPETPKQVLSMTERFMGLRAALVTDNSSVQHFGKKLGFTVVTLTNGQSSDSSADELLKMLGFQDGNVLDKDYFDLVLLHIGDLEFTNSMVGRILDVAQPGSVVGSRVHLSLVMSFADESKLDPELSLESLADENDSKLRCLFPRQSYTLKGVDLRNDTRHTCPMLVAQYQDAVTRKDTVQEFSFEEFKKKSGNLAIAADRFIYEVAFKLWKAPKYGA